MTGITKKDVKEALEGSGKENKKEKNKPEDRLKREIKAKLKRKGYRYSAENLFEDFSITKLAYLTGIKKEFEENYLVSRIRSLQRYLYSFFRIHYHYSSFVTSTYTYRLHVDGKEGFPKWCLEDIEEDFLREGISVRRKINRALEKISELFALDHLKDESKSNLKQAWKSKLQTLENLVLDLKREAILKLGGKEEAQRDQVATSKIGRKLEEKLEEMKDEEKRKIWELLTERKKFSKQSEFRRVYNKSYDANLSKSEFSRKLNDLIDILRFRNKNKELVEPIKKRKEGNKYIYKLGIPTNEIPEQV